MKRKLLILSLFCVLLMLLPACVIKAEGSLKSITSPYVAEYECIEARLGEQNLLDQYEFIKITLLDKSELEVSFKPKNGERKAFKGAYKVDPETKEFTGEIGILGFTFKESVIIEKGEFVITKNIMSAPLIMKFKMK